MAASVATPLPSFVELMASLGLSNKDFAQHPPTPSTFDRAFSFQTSSSLSSSRRSSVSSQLSLDSNPDSHMYNTSKISPSIVISQHEPSATAPEECDKSLGRARAARYSPYQTTNMPGRRCSVPSLESSVTDVKPTRPTSTSPRMRSASPSQQRQQEKTIFERRAARAKEPGFACAPISTFARRRTPASSPTSPTFPHRSRRRENSIIEPVSPVSIPMLLPLLSQSYIPTPDESEESSMDEELPATPAEFGTGESEMVVTHHSSQTGVRISAPYRSIRSRSSKRATTYSA